MHSLLIYLTLRKIIYITNVTENLFDEFTFNGRMADNFTDVLAYQMSSVVWLVWLRLQYLRITDDEEMTGTFTATDRYSFPPGRTEVVPQQRTVWFHWSRSSECRWLASTSGSGSGPCSGRLSSPSLAMPSDEQLCWSSLSTLEISLPGGPRRASVRCQYLNNI